MTEGFGAPVFKFCAPGINIIYPSFPHRLSGDWIGVDPDMLHLTDNHGGDAGAAEILHGFQRAFQRDEAFLDDRRGNRAGVFQCEATGGKLIGVQFVLADCFDQRVVITHRRKLTAKTPVRLMLA